MMNFKGVADLNNDVKRWLSSIPKDVDIVVGIPRSGMLVANLVSLYLNKPLADIDGFLAGRVLGLGVRKKFQDDAEYKRVLVIDDSVLTGRALLEAKEKLRAANANREYIFGAPYVTPDKTELVDTYFEILPIPRIFEWNLMHHPLISNSCMDIDGILCRDPLPEENDDGPAYKKFISEIPVKFGPTEKVKWLVTSRLEKYRALTERWLSKNSIIYENLVMLDLPNKEDRIRAGAQARFKAEIYKKTGATLFIESARDQAAEIARLSNKCVVCTDSGEMFYPGMAYRAYRNSRNAYQIAKGRIRAIVASMKEKHRSRGSVEP